MAHADEIIELSQRIGGIAAEKIARINKINRATSSRATAIPTRAAAAGSIS